MGFMDGSNLRIFRSTSPSNLVSAGSTVAAHFEAINTSVSDVRSYVLGAQVSPTYGVTVTVDLSLGSTFLVTATNGTAFTVSNPTATATGASATPAGRKISIIIKNSSGGSLGTITWGSKYQFKSSWINPANGSFQVVTFECDGTNFIEINSTQLELEAKNVVVSVRSTLQTNPVADFLSFNPGSGTYAASSDSVKAPLALLRGAGVSNEFNTDTAKIGSSASPSELHFKCQVLDANGELFYDASGNEVWGVISVNARTGATTTRLHFFTGAFSSAAAAHVMGADFYVVYPQRYDLSTMPEASFRSFIFENLDSASIAADAVKGIHIDFADVLNSNGGLEEQASDTLGIKLPVNAGLTSGASGLEINDDNSTVELNANVLRVKALGITDSHLASGAVTAGKIATGGVSAAGQFGAGVVDSAALASSAVTAGKIATGGVSAAGQFAAGVVDSAALASSAVTAGKIATGGVSAAGQFAAGVVDAAALAAGAVTAGKIATGGVSAAGQFAAGVVDSAALASSAVTAGKIATGGISASGQFAAGVVDNAAIATGTIQAAKLDLTGETYDFASSTLRCGTPSGSTDVANKSYVDGVAQGLQIKDEVRLASTANFVAARVGSILTETGNGAVGNVDGVAIQVGDRILIKDQTTGADNGIYTLTDAGSAGTPYIFTRAADADASAEVESGMFVFVSEGTANADSGWVLTTNDPITLNTTSLAFSQFSGAGQITAGSALTKTGNTLDVGVDNATIEVNADALRVKASGITSNELASQAVSAGKINIGGVSNANQFAAGVVDSTALGSAAVTAGKIAVGGVSNANQFAAGVVDSTALASAAVSAGKIAVGGVSNANQFAAGVVDSTALASAAVSAGKIAVGGVSNANQFAAGVVDSTALASAAVTAGKIAVGGVSNANQFASAVVDNAAVASNTVAATQLRGSALGAGGATTRHPLEIITVSVVTPGTDWDANNDIILYSANSPALRIIDFWVDNDTAEGGALTATLRDAASGGGNAISSALDLNATTVQRTTSLASATLAANSSLVINANGNPATQVCRFYISAIRTA